MTQKLAFSRAGVSADVRFARVAADSSRLSVLNITGVPLSFDPGIYSYTAQVYDLTETFVTALPETPSAEVSVTLNGNFVSTSAPLALRYGTNTLTFTVTSGESSSTYTIIITINRYQNSNGSETDGGSGGQRQGAVLTIGGVNRGELAVSLRNGRAVVSLGTLAQEIFAGSAQAVLEIPTISEAMAYTLELPADALAGMKTGGAITVSTGLGSLCLPADMLGSRADTLTGKVAAITIARGEKSKLTSELQALVGDRPLFTLTLTLDGEPVEWSNPDAPIAVTIPYVPSPKELEIPECLLVWYLDGMGNAVPVPNARYDAATGTLRFETTHFSDFAAGFKLVDFSDVLDSVWYAAAVRFIAARSITTGTTETTFSPDSPVTRGQFIVMLMRAYGIKPGDGLGDNFTDAGDTYYTDYLAQAKAMGISYGVGDNLFKPEQPITRQEMFTLLYRALDKLSKLPEGIANKTLDDFSDGASVADYAKDAMTALVKGGVIAGSEEKLNPQVGATRAQMAQVLYKLMAR